MRQTLTRFVFGLIALVGLGGLARANEPAPSEEIAELIQQGRADALDRRLKGGSNATEQNWLAQAFLVAASKEARDRDERNRLYAKADEFYAVRLENLPKLGFRPLTKQVGLAQTHLARGRLLTLLWPRRVYDDFRITNGIRGDRAWLAEKFTAAVVECREAYKLANNLYEQRDAREDEFIAASVYDTVAALRLDSVLIRAWARYRLGLVTDDETVRQEALTKAEEDFRNLIEHGASGATIYQCYLGQGLALRELGQYEAADKALQRIIDDGGADPALLVRIAYERALVLLGQQQWDAARAKLKPLAEQDVRRLPKELAEAQFYYNLARIMVARSYLLEAGWQAERARGEQNERAFIRLARETRDRGLREFRQLSRQGGAWATLAQLYIVDSVDRLANPDSLSPTAILYAVRDMRSTNPSKARRWIDSALERPNIEPDLLAELIFELGVVEHEMRHYRLAAAAFARVASEFRSDSQAPIAAGHALKLWQHAATESEAAEDYAALAQAARVILESFPEHELRDQARWVLPRALEAAGDYDAAAHAYAAIQHGEEHWEEAQQRAVLLGRRVVESQRGKLAPDAFRQAAVRAAAALAEYADASFARGASLGPQDRKQVRQWSAIARLRGAELLVASDVGEYEAALNMLERFEQAYPDSEQTGAVLGVRIRALNGLRRFEEASEMVSRFLKETAPDKVGGVLGALAAGMRTEVEHLAELGQIEAARELARGALPTFEQLAAWAEETNHDELRPVVGVSLARMNYLAGEYDTAEKMVRQWLQKAPKDGNLQLLLAQILTARLDDSSSAEAVTAAQEAWDGLLVAPDLREQAPAVYWEALYHRMALMLRSGAAKEVYDAIGQQQIWHPELGGPKWQVKYLQLRAQAASAAGIKTDAPPSSTSDSETQDNTDQDSETDNDAS